ncbi:MAG: hypothetical protein HRT71_19145 [Flavobacteriales bacterium]|nr:hypothetical protein [Flavobacteriales bacterium]
MNEKDIALESMSSLLRIEALQKSNQMANAKILSIIRRTEFKEELRLLSESTDIIYADLFKGVQKRHGFKNKS